MSVYNRLSRPIAVLGYRSAYMQLCEFANVDPHVNDVFYHVHDFATAAAGEFCRVLEIDGAEETREYRHVKTIALDRVRNEARARKIIDDREVEQ